MSILEMFQLNGKNALVTGSSRGLGAAIALALAGANVGCHGKSSQDAISGRIRRLGKKSFYFSGDIADPTTHSRLIEKTIKSALCPVVRGVSTPGPARIPNSL
jgi:NAD(P)-dependent dehydrogenase (short-subunit alcohol dehydrogenase family)